MAFRYSLKQKRIARQNDSSTLHKAYEISERRLKHCARKGSNKEMEKAMKYHKDIEYALYYQQSPEYKKQVLKKHNAKIRRYNGKL